MKRFISKGFNWLFADIHRLWWLAILLLPLLAFFLDKNFLIPILSLLIAFPIVEFVFGFLGIFVEGRGQKTAASGNLYTTKIKAFPAFVTEIIAVAYFSMWLEQLVGEYLSTALNSVIVVYFILGCLYIYYYFWGSKR